MSGVGVRCMGDARGRGGKGVRRGGKQSAGGGGALPATDKQGNRTSLLGRVGTQMQTKVSKSGKYCRTAFSMSLFSNSVQHSSDNVPSFRILCYWSTSKMGGLDPVDSATISACLLINKPERLCVCVWVSWEKLDKRCCFFVWGATPKGNAWGDRPSFFSQRKSFCPTAKR